MARKTKNEVPYITEQDLVNYFPLPKGRREVIEKDATKLGPIPESEIDGELRDISRMFSELAGMIREFNLQHAGTEHDRDWVQRDLESMKGLVHDIQEAQLLYDIRSDPKLMAKTQQRGPWLRKSKEERAATIQRMQEGRAAKTALRTSKRRSTLTKDKLRERHAARSKRARTADARSTAKTVIDPARFNAPVEKWYDDPGGCDLKGIDTKPATRKSLSEMTPEERHARARRAMSTGSKKYKHKRARTATNVDTHRVMNAGLQKHTMMAMADARGMAVEEMDIDAMFDPSLTLEENWQQIEADQRSYIQFSPEASILEKFPRRRRKILRQYSSKALYGFAKPNGGTTRMNKEELIDIIIKARAWRTWHA